MLTLPYASIFLTLALVTLFAAMYQPQGASPLPNPRWLLRAVLSAWLLWALFLLVQQIAHHRI